MSAGSWCKTRTTATEMADETAEATAQATGYSQRDERFLAVRVDAAASRLFEGDGAMRARSREFDWAATPFGPVQEWPESLRTAARLVIDSPFPAVPDVAEAIGRSQAEAGMHASEARYRLIVEGARDYAILTMDAGGRIDSWSPGAEAAFGWTAAEAEGKVFASVFTPEDQANGTPERELATARDNGVAADVRWHLRKDGSRTFIDGTTHSIRGDAGELRGYLKIGHDITRRRELNEALSASEARYRALVENVQDYAIFLLDAHGIITEWPAGAQRVMGYMPDEVLGLHMSILHTPDEIAAGEPARELAEAAATGRAEREALRVRKGGARFRANEITTAVHDDTGTLVGFTMVSRDLTQWLLADAAAQRDVLRRRLAQAEEDERRRLARELHDEAGQHLTALALGLQALADVVPAGSEVDRRTTQLRELTNILSQELHALAVRLRPKALDDFGLESALEAYTADWSRQSGMGVEIHARVQEERLPAPTEDAVYRIVQEALTNTAKHSRATCASVLVERQDGHVLVVVEDDGCGFNPESPAESRAGIPGIGLLGMRERVALLGGALEVESAPGKGTSIFVRIPVDPSAGQDDLAVARRAGDSAARKAEGHDV